jgi:hypothetical protein
MYCAASAARMRVLSLCSASIAMPHASISIFARAGRDIEFQPLGSGAVEHLKRAGSGEARIFGQDRLARLSLRARSLDGDKLVSEDASFAFIRGNLPADLD